MGYQVPGVRAYQVLVVRGCGSVTSRHPAAFVHHQSVF